MKRRIISLIAGIGFAATAFVVAPALAPPEMLSASPVVQFIAPAPQEAAAGTNFGTVHDKSGSAVKIWCDYGQGSPNWLYEDGQKGPHWSTSTSCYKDTDQLASYHDGRCMYIRSVSDKDGYYYIKPDKKYKIKGGTVATVEAYKSSRCSKSKEWPIT